MRLYPGGPVYDEDDHEFFRKLETDEERIQYVADVFTGVFTLGIPEAYHMAEAIYYGDEEQFWYSVKVTATIHSMFYLAYNTVMLWDIFRHGGKNFMSFHKVMQGFSVLRSMFWKAALLSTPGVMTGAAISNQLIWDEIGDVKTGSVHWARAGTMSGGSMPIISGDGGDHTTWFPEMRKWFD